MPGALATIDLAAEGVTYREYDIRDGNSPVEAFPPDRPHSAARRFLVSPYEKRDVFIRWVLGEAGLSTDDADPEDEALWTLSRTAPRPHPKFPKLFATAVTSVRGFKPAPGGPGAGTGTKEYLIEEYGPDYEPTDVAYRQSHYASAVIDVAYEQLLYEPWDDRQLQANQDEGDVGTGEGEWRRFTSFPDPQSSADLLQLPGMVMAFTDEDPNNPVHDRRITYGASVVLPKESFPVVWHRVPESAWGPGKPLWRRVYGEPDASPAKLPYLGTTNKKAIFGRARGTLVLSGFNPVRRPAPAGSGWEFDLVFHYTFDPYRVNFARHHTNDKDHEKNGWYFLSARGTWVNHSTDVTPVPDFDSLYNERDHFDLFRAWEVGP